METQVNQLKLNVTNINSYLINSNKQLTKLRKDKKNLFETLEKKKELRAEESRLESKNLKIGSGFSKIAGAISTPARSIFDKILEFFGLIAIGVLVQKLPEIITKINQFFESDAFKSIKSMFSTLAKGVDFLIDLTTTNVDEKKLKDEGKTITENSEKLKKASEEINSKKAEYEKIKSDLEKSKSTKPEQPSGTGGPLGGSIPKVQERAQGGTIDNKPNTSPTYTPRKSGPLKYAERGMESGFNGFSESVDKIEEYSKKEEENMLAFAEMSKNFKTWSSLSGISTTPYGGILLTQNQPGQPRPLGSPNEYQGQTFAQGQGKIGPTGDTDGQHTGLNMHLPGGIGTPIYAPFDLIYKQVGTDGMPAVGLDGNPNPLNKRLGGRGFGYYGAYFFNKNGKEYEVLLGHFRDLPYKGSADGEVIPKGTLLGYQGASGASDPGDGTNNPYPHISLHVNGVNFINGDNGILVDFANKLTTATPSVKPAKKPKGPISSSGNGGKRVLNTSSRGGNQSLFVYAVQPVETFVPFPYPVPIESSSSSPAPSKPRVPSGWRA